MYKVYHLHLHIIFNLVCSLPHPAPTVSSAESIIIKVLWMIFLVIMFYLSLEMFLNIVKKRKDQVVGGAVGGMGGGEL